MRKYEKDLATEFANTDNNQKFAEEHPYFCLKECIRAGKTFKPGDPWDWKISFVPTGLFAPLADKGKYQLRGGVNPTKGTAYFEKIKEKEKATPATKTEFQQRREELIVKFGPLVALQPGRGNEDQIRSAILTGLFLTT